MKKWLPSMVWPVSDLMDWVPSPTWPTGPEHNPRNPYWWELIDFRQGDNHLKQVASGKADTIEELADESLKALKSYLLKEGIKLKAGTSEDLISDYEEGTHFDGKKYDGYMIFTIDGTAEKLLIWITQDPTTIRESI